MCELQYIIISFLDYLDFKENFQLPTSGSCLLRCERGVGVSSDSLNNTLSTAAVLAALRAGRMKKQKRK
jgi:hypothetical protein